MSAPVPNTPSGEHAPEGERPAVEGHAKIVARKDPAAARALAHWYLANESKCSPADFRKLGVIGGSDALNTLLGEVRAERPENRGREHLESGGWKPVALPPEFQRLHDAVLHATNTFSARIHAEAQEHGAHSLARVQQAADVAASRLKEELDAIRADSTALAAALEDAEGRAADALLSRTELQLRLENMQLSQRPLIAAADDLRTAVQRKDNAYEQLTSENSRLREFVAAGDVKLVAAETANRELRDIARSHETEVRHLRVALEARVQEVAALHGSLETIVKTNASLAARRAPSSRGAKTTTPAVRRGKGVGKTPSPRP